MSYQQMSLAQFQQLQSQGQLQGQYYCGSCKQLYNDNQAYTKGGQKYHQNEGCMNKCDWNRTRNNSWK